MEKETVIHADGLTKQFGNFTAVDHISFDVARGEVFGFLGANGAGKTTAMRMLCGLSRPTSGTGTVAGFDITRQHEKIKRNIGYMSQKFSLYEDLKVWENIRLYAGIYGMKDAEIARKTDELLERLDFTRERNTMVQSLPLGWKQKLAFSVSIFHDPAIDLAVISAILSSNMDAAIEPEVCMAGEIGLSGEIRPVNRIEQRIGEAEKLGFKRFLLPKYNLQGIDTKKLKIELVPVRKVEEAFRALFG